MDICSSGHDEVCFETRRCPACDLVKERDDESAEVKRLEEKLDDAHGRIAALMRAADENV